MFELKIDTGNAAFDGNPACETARLLREVADKLLMNDYFGGDGDDNPIRDINGNKVGRFTILSTQAKEG